MSKPTMVREPRLRISRYRGMTFIELMITLIVFAILLTVGIPSVRDFIVSSQTTNQTNQLLADFALARTQAVTLSRSVRVSAEAGAWENGWTVASDINLNGAVDAAGFRADELFRQQEASPEDFRLTMTDAGGIALTSLWFDRLGVGVQNLPSGDVIQFPVRFLIERPDRVDAKATTLCVAASGIALSRKGNVLC